MRARARLRRPTRRQFVTDNSIATWVTISSSSDAPQRAGLSGVVVGPARAYPHALALPPIFFNGQLRVSLIALVPRDMHRRYLCRRTLFEHLLGGRRRRWFSLGTASLLGLVTTSVKYPSSLRIGINKIQREESRAVGDFFFSPPRETGDIACLMRSDAFFHAERATDVRIAREILALSSSSFHQERRKEAKKKDKRGNSLS